MHRVEGEALRREAAAIPTMAEMLERTPEIETPAYAVLASHEAEGWEVRSQRVHDRARHARAMPCACHMRAMHMHMLHAHATCTCYE